MADPSQEDEPREREPTWFYIGMSDNLRDRFREHERGSSALMRKLNEYLRGEDASLHVSLQREQSICHAGETGSVDLTSSVVRILFEHAAIAAYRHDNPRMQMVNVERRNRSQTDASPPPEPDDFWGPDDREDDERPF